MPSRNPLSPERGTAGEDRRRGGGGAGGPQRGTSGREEWSQRWRLGDRDNSIYYGIKTGYNSAFIVDDGTRERLVAEDPRSADILKPILRGRDIGRYQAKWAGKWLIATLPSLGIDIDAYPVVKRHLLAFGRPRLAQSGTVLPDGSRSRKKTPHRWFELQDTCAYHHEFAKEKVFWIDLTDEGRFAYADGGEMFCVNSAYMLSGSSIRLLCAILNSNLIGWFMRNTALNSGMGVSRWIRSTVDAIPVPQPANADAHLLTRLVDDILRRKADNPSADTRALEAQIDQMVYRLYGLTAEETAMVGRIPFAKGRTEAP